jgi:hypothetical protein
LEPSFAIALVVPWKLRTSAHHGAVFYPNFSVFWSIAQQRGSGRCRLGSMVNNTDRASGLSADLLLFSR